MAVQPVPDGYHTITPCLVAVGAAKLIDFITQAFGAEQLDRMDGPDGTVMHAELRIGNSMLMIGESQGEWKPTPSLLHLYVKDVDATYTRAVRAGATSVQPVADQFYGDRKGTVRDSWGNLWSIGTHIEDVAPDEMRRRGEAAMKKK
ncbi:MAG TPA: VOC family protein [Candidatus Krumholzibacteria bacterium]|nr:VOC family protein [Candidatus Krumholzibacteria bacterium]